MAQLQGVNHPYMNNIVIDDPILDNAKVYEYIDEKYCLYKGKKVLISYVLPKIGGFKYLIDLINKDIPKANKNYDIYDKMIREGYLTGLWPNQMPSGPGIITTSTTSGSLIQPQPLTKNTLTTAINKMKNKNFNTGIDINKTF